MHSLEIKDLKIAPLIEMIKIPEEQQSILQGGLALFSYLSPFEFPVRQH